MVVADKTLNLAELRLAARSTPALRPYVSHLALIEKGIREGCADEVLWAVAHGSFLDLIDSGRSGRSRRPMKLFVVTNLNSVYESHVLLAERVLGPLLAENGLWTEYEAWTLGGFRNAVERGTSDLLLEIQARSVTLFGSPPSTRADA